MIKRFESLTNMTFKQYFKAMKRFFIVGAIVLVIVMIIMAATALLESSAPKDFYTVQENTAPAFESVVGQRRGRLWRNNADEVAYAFRQTKTSTDDVEKYIRSLQDSGYTLLEQSLPDEPLGTTLLMKEAKQPSNIISINITYPQKGQKGQDVLMGVLKNSNKTQKVV